MVGIGFFSEVSVRAVWGWILVGALILGGGGGTERRALFCGNMRIRFHPLSKSSSPQRELYRVQYYCKRRLPFNSLQFKVDWRELGALEC